MLTHLYNRRQPYVFAVMFGVLGMIGFVVIAISKSDSDRELLVLAGLVALAVLAMMAGHRRGAPRVVKRPTRRSWRSTVSMSLAGTAGGMALLRADEVVVVVVAALLVPYVAWGSGRAWHGAAVFTREIERVGDQQP